MSTILAAATSQPTQQQLFLSVLLFALLMFATLISPWLAMAVGVFSRGSLDNRGRIGPHESPWLLGAVLASGFGVFVLAANAVAAALPSMSVLSRALAALMGGEVVAVVLVILLLRRLRHHGLERMGLDGRRLARSIFPAIMADLIIVPWVIWITLASNWLLQAWHPNLQLTHQFFREWNEPGVTAAFKIMAFMSAVVVAPVAEELLFRGLIQTLLRNVMRSGWLGIFISAGMFAMVHFDRELPQPFGWLFAPPIFVLALGLGWAYERTGSLWVCIFMHMLFNALGFTLFLIGGSM